MEKGLLLVERYVLEAIFQGVRTLEGLHRETHLPPLILRNIVKQMLQEGIIKKEEGKEGEFTLERRGRKSWMQQMQNPLHLKGELKEMMEAVVENHFQREQKEKGPRQGHLLIQKLWMSEAEWMMFQSHYRRLQVMLEGIQNENRNLHSRKTLAQKKVVVCGYSDYGTLLQAGLKNL